MDISETEGLRRRLQAATQQLVDDQIAEMLHEGLGPREEEPGLPSHYDVEPGYYDGPDEPEWMLSDEIDHDYRQEGPWE